MIIVSILLIILSCLIIWKASDGFEVASEYLGRNLSEGVRGATINAIGSSIPELFTTLFFLFVLKDKEGFSGGIGTTAGSAIFNAMIIPAVVILVVVFAGVTKSIKVSKKVILRDGLSLLLCELILIFLLGGNALDWWHGLILMLLYVGYASYMLLSMKSEDTVKEEDIDDGEQIYTGKTFWNLIKLDLESVFLKNGLHFKSAWILLLFAMMVIGGACLLLVKSCEWLGEELHVPIYFIAVVLASAATSVPDTILSMKDARKGNYDDAVSNALGSNIFDVCFALGFPLFVFCLIYGPISMSPETIQNIAELRILLFILTFLAFLIFIVNTKMNIVSALLLLSLYVIFAVIILGDAYGTSYSKVVSEELMKINNFLIGLIH